MSTAPYIALAQLLDRIHSRLARRRDAQQLAVETTVNVVVDDEPVGGPEDCEACTGTQLVLVKPWASGTELAVTCPACDGTGERGAA